MKRKFLTVASLVMMCVATIAITVNSGKAERAEFEAPDHSQPALIKPLPSPADALSTACALQPEAKSGRAIAALYPKSPRPLGSVALARFRQVQSPLPSATASSPSSASSPDRTSTRPTLSYQPREEIVLIDSTNYGDRYLRDLDGNPANLDPLIVLHETVGSAASAISLFQTPHPNDNDQVSYHTLIRQEGTITYLVPPDKRAFGAGNSVFPGANGLEAVRTNPAFPASVNNFAYHISLETPADGNNNAYRHSGYTALQYQSLAWLVAKTGVADNRITTHKAVDRSGQRMDPRSFSSPRFFQLLQTYTKVNEIAIRCTPPPNAESQVPQQKLPRSSVRSSPPA